MRVCDDGVLGHEEGVVSGLVEGMLFLGTVRVFDGLEHGGRPAGTIGCGGLSGNVVLTMFIWGFLLFGMMILSILVYSGSVRWIPFWFLDPFWWLRSLVIDI